MAAFDLALAMGADALELDVRATADGHLVLVHDRTLERTTGDPAPVASRTLAQLAALGPARPLRLGEVLRRYGTRTRYWIELKDPAPAAERRLVHVLRRHRVHRHAVIQSFDHASLRRLHGRHPGLAFAALFCESAPVTEVCAQLGDVSAFAGRIGPCAAVVDELLVRRAHARGLAVHPYTVNAEPELARLIALGVDGIFTDVPDRLRGMLAPVAPVTAPALAA